MKCVLAAALIAGAAAVGCKEDRGAAFDCVCTGLTDFDAPIQQVVTICAPSAARAPALARGCAQTNAPVQIQSCTCQPAKVSACAADACMITITP